MSTHTKSKLEKMLEKDNDSLPHRIVSKLTEFARSISFILFITQMRLLDVCTKIPKNVRYSLYTAFSSITLNLISWFSAQALIHSIDVKLWKANYTPIVGSDTFTVTRVESRGIVLVTRPPEPSFWSYSTELTPYWLAFFAAFIVAIIAICVPLNTRILRMSAFTV